MIALGIAMGLSPVLPTVGHRSVALSSPVLMVTPQTGGDVADQSLSSLPRAADRPAPPFKIDPNALGVVVTADSALVIDGATGRVLFEKQADTPRSIASITKLMTALVFLEHNPGWQTTVTITAADATNGGVSLLSVGQEVSVRDLFYAMLVRSVNSAASALARSTGLSEGEFTAAMNAKAASLGMASAVFIEPTGLHARNQASAVDVAKLVSAALAETAITNATTLPSFRLTTVNGDQQLLESTDQLLGSFLNTNGYQIIGGKTGHIDNAGYSFTVVVADRDGHQIISVVLGSASLDDRFTDTKALVNWAFSHYRWP